MILVGHPSGRINFPPFQGKGSHSPPFSKGGGRGDLKAGRTDTCYPAALPFRPRGVGVAHSPAAQPLILRIPSSVRLPLSRPETSGLRSLPGHCIFDCRRFFSWLREGSFRTWSWGAWTDCALEASEGTDLVSHHLHKFGRNSCGFALHCFWTKKAMGTCPLNWSSAPMTAHSATSGCCATISSMAPVESLCPATLMTSSTLPMTYTYPSSSR